MLILLSANIIANQLLSTKGYWKVLQEANIEDHKDTYTVPCLATTNPYFQTLNFDDTFKRHQLASPVDNALNK